MTPIYVEPSYVLHRAIVRKVGNSFVLTLPRLLRERLHLMSGSVVAIRLHEPYATLARFEAPQIADPNTLPPHKLPPRSIKELDRETEERF